MTKNIIFGLATLLSVSTFAQLGELEVGSKAQDNKSYISQTDAAVIAHVNEEIKDKCDSHGCTFVARVDHKKGWTMTFNLGNGPANAGGTGTTINLGNGQQAANSNYYGISLSYTNMTCTSDFKIDMDDFINNKARAIAERESDGTYNMKPLTSDMKFVQLLKLEIYKQLGQAGCLR
jgi:hypothetical protein